MVTRGRREEGAEGQPGEGRERQTFRGGGRKERVREQGGKRWGEKQEMDGWRQRLREKMRGVGMRDRKRLSGRNFMWNCLWDLVTISGYFMLAWIFTPSSDSSLIISPLFSRAAVIGCSRGIEAKSERVNGVSRWTNTFQEAKSSSSQRHVSKATYSPGVPQQQSESEK